MFLDKNLGKADMFGWHEPKPKARVITRDRIKRASVILLCLQDLGL
jgi:hypothetical protein